MKNNRTNYRKNTFTRKYNKNTFNLFKKVNGKWGEPIGNVKGGDGDSGYDRLYTSRNYF